jgi:hypothetical protein
MDLFSILAEQKIKEAYENGEFDNLPGYGKPQDLNDLSHVPQELRAAYRLMKNAGFSPEESAIKQEIMTVESLIKSCDDEDQKQLIQNQLNEKMLRYNQLMSKNRIKTNSSMFKDYGQKIEDKLTR